jgi:hypothetical protein
LDILRIRIETRIRRILQIRDQAGDEGDKGKLHHAETFAFRSEEEHLEQREHDAPPWLD